MLRSLLVLLLLGVAALRVHAADDVRKLGLSHHSRRLFVSARCPDGCVDGYCMEAATEAGLYCSKCMNNLVTDKATGACLCTKGKFSDGSPACEDCPKGSWCAGGVFSVKSPPAAVPCPANMTTLGLRSQTVRSCVNLPGFFYIFSSSGGPSATLCPENCYSPGLRKQRACVPCPTGFTTNGQTGQRSLTACVIPPGYYLKAPGVVAACSQGEWKAGFGAAPNCTQCPSGVTTASVGAIAAEECKFVAPGYYASSFNPDGSVGAVLPCPQGSFCPQTVQAQPGSSGMIACPDGTWTKAIAASALQECLTPPGFYTAGGSTQPCPAGSYRADWLPADQASACTPCGEGVKAAKTERITQYLPDGSEVLIPVTSSADDCYIQAGQGLYFEAISKTWKAQNCRSNNYGVTNITYGLTPAPCRECPSGMVAVNSAAYNVSAQHFVRNADGSGGFNSEMACVTKPGFGMSGRAAQRCDQGTYNSGNNYDACKPCPYSTTTTAAGAGVTEADCVPSTGFGLINGKVQMCPAGTYNDVVATGGTTCKACPDGITTEKSGSSSPQDCQLCMPGRGGPNCSLKCGGSGVNATYGPPGRSVYSGAACLPCSGQGKTVTYSFFWNFENDAFSPGTVARYGAASPIECLSEYSQLIDGNYYLALSSDEGVTRYERIPNFAACVDLCSKADCQLVTYDYATQDCFVRVSNAPYYEGMPWLGLKVLPAGYVGTSPWSIANNSAKALSSGVYTFYQEPQALAVGIQVPAPKRDTFTSVQQCMAACDEAGTGCAGFTVLSTVKPLEIPKTCMMIQANRDVGGTRRTVVRADLNRLGLPSSFLCPSGYTNDPTQAKVCEPLKTPAVVYIFMRAQETCSAALLESVKTSFSNFLGDPNTAFGVYVPGIAVNVACFDVPALQGTTQSGRRLQQNDIIDIPSERFADLVVSVSYPGTTEGGQNVVTACSTGACTRNVTAVRFVAGEVVAGSRDDVKNKDPSTVLVQQQTLPGETYKFVARYTIQGQPSAALLTLTTTPSSVVVCKATEQGVGVTAFECYPLEAGSNVVFTANGPDPATAFDRIQMSMTVPNITCLKGSTPDNVTSKCIPCPAGTYAPALATQCTPCPEGFTTPSSFSYSVAQCTLCKPGRENITCTECNVGRFSLGGVASTNLTCSKCPRGTTTRGRGASDCPICAQGFFSENGAPLPSPCQECWQGSGTTTKTAETKATHPEEVCTICDVGYYSVDGKAFRQDGSLRCTICDTSTSTLGPETSGSSSSCKVCAIGFYSSNGFPVQGTTPPCRKCPDGASTTDVGTTGDSDEQACTDCEPEYTGPGCKQCALGSGFLEWQLEALQQGTATDVVDGMLRCYPAPVGFWSDGGSRKDASGLFIPCPPGTHTGDVRGAFSEDACVVCGYGYYSITGKLPAGGNCTQCPGFTTTLQTGTIATNASVCVCEAGYESDGNGGCRACSIGFWSRDGGQCEACPTGRTTLTAGTGALSGELGCYVCAAGWYSDNGFVPPSTESCNECPAGATTPGPITSGNDAQACSVCLPGYAGTPGNCTACPVGTFAAGGFANGTVCSPCPDGSTTSGTASTNCSACPMGEYSSTGSPPCTRCGEGYTTNSSGTVADAEATACTYCAVGYFSQSDDGTLQNGGVGCTVCDGGLTTPGPKTGRSGCTVCAIGFYSETGKPREGDGQCTQCPTGAITPAAETRASDETACIRCDTGYVGQAPNCDQCAPGYGYLEDNPENPAPCYKAPAGYWSPGGPRNIAEGLFTKCPAGTSSGSDTIAAVTATSNWTSQCTLCGEGWYSQDGKIPEGGPCTPCPINMTTMDIATKTGPTACVCSTGFWSTSGSSTCQACDPSLSSTKNSIGSSSAEACTLCQMGYYYGVDSKCTKCPEGSSTRQEVPQGSVDGTAACDYCLKGYWDDWTNGGCQPCPDGYTTDGDAAGGFAAVQACTVCSRGYYQSQAADVTSDPATPKVCTQCPDKFTTPQNVTEALSENQCTEPL